MLPIPKTDPVYVEIVAALALHRGPGQLETVGRLDEDLVHDLLQVVAEDRIRRELDALSAAGAALASTAMSPEQRLAAGEDPDDDEDLGAVWVASGVSALGVYTCEITYTDDVVRVLNPDQVGPYADTLTEAVVQAEHDAAIIAQLTSKVGLGAKDAWFVALALRESRPALDQRPVRPLLVRASVGQNTGQPYVTLRLSGTKLRWRWDTADALAHAQYVRETRYVADLDGAYRRYLVSHLGLDDGTARAVVGELRRHRHPRTD